MRGNRQAGKTWFFTFTDVTLSSSLKCEHERIHFWWIISDGKSRCSCWLFMTFRENTLLLRLLIKTCQKLWGCCALFFYLPSVLYAIVLLYSVSLPTVSAVFCFHLIRIQVSFWIYIFKFPFFPGTTAYVTGILSAFPRDKQTQTWWHRG